jgi:hypothetical protein
MASPDLEILPDDEISAYTNLWGLYVYIRSPRDEMKPRVVAIAQDVEDWRSADFEVFLDDGCPVALPLRGEHDMEYWRDWYETMKKNRFDTQSGERHGYSRLPMSGGSA